MLFANLFFQTKPVIQALDTDTQIWEEAKIEGFEGTNHVRVNFIRWGKNKNTVRVLFCDPQVDLELWPVRKALQEVILSRRYNIDYKLGSKRATTKVRKRRCSTLRWINCPIC